MTTADEKRDELIEVIKTARVLTQEITNHETWGYDHFNDEFIDYIALMNIDLTKMSRRIEP